MDRLTLFSMQAGLLIFMGIIVFMTGQAQKRDQSDNAAAWFGVAYVLGGTGLLLGAYRYKISPFWAIIVGNILFLTMFVFIEKAVAIATRRTSRMVPLTALLLLSFIGLCYFTYLRFNVSVRVLIVALVMTALQMFICHHLAVCNEPIIRPALRGMIAVLIASILFTFGRMVFAFLHHQPDSGFTWAGILFIAGLALAFLWIDSLRLRSELEQRAMTDPLTGLLNRRALEEFATRALSHSARHGLPCSALTLDIDHFKQINDTYGHSAGDSTLIAVAEILRTSLRTSDLVTRIGGDEFFILLPTADELAANTVVERLRSTVETLQLKTVRGQNFRISISIGAVTRHGEHPTIEELFHDSDMMLYREKERSRQRQANQLPHSTFSPSPSSITLGGAQVHPSNS